MDLQYAEIDAANRAVALVILDESGKTWSPVAKAFVEGKPLDGQIPLVKPAGYPGVVLAVVPGIVGSTVFAFLADASGTLFRPMPYQVVEPPDNYIAVVTQSPTTR